MLRPVKTQTNAHTVSNTIVQQIISGRALGEVLVGRLAVHLAKPRADH